MIAKNQIGIFLMDKLTVYNIFLCILVNSLFTTIYYLFVIHPFTCNFYHLLLLSNYQITYLFFFLLLLYMLRVLKETRKLNIHFFLNTFLNIFNLPMLFIFKLYILS